MKKKEKATPIINEDADSKKKTKRRKKNLTPEESEARKALNIIKAKCLTAIICAVVIALSISSIFGKLSEALTPPSAALSELDSELSISDDYFTEDNIFTDSSDTSADTPTQEGNTSSEEGSTADSTVSDNAVTDSNAVSTPLTYSKAELITYYNNCLKKSYSQSKMNATKTEFVDVSVSGIDIGSFKFDVDKIVQDIVDKNTTANNKPQTKSFANGTSSDGVLAEKFVLPANLYEGAVKNIKAVKQGSGYKVAILLNQESCPYTELPPFNSSCAWPLDFTVIDFGWALEIYNCSFNYPGTLLTALIDSQNRVTSVKVEMPLTISNANAKAIGLVNINVSSISGKWTCVNQMTF